MIWENLITSLENDDKNSLFERPIYKKDILKTNDFNVALVSLKKGEKIPPHPEDYAVFFFIVQGKAIFTTNKGNISLKKDSSIYYKKNELRGIQSEEDLILLGIQEPH